MRRCPRGHDRLRALQVAAKPFPVAATSRSSAGASSASPNLFTADIAGKQRDLVGEGQKSGDYWALDRDSGGIVWTTKVAPAGFLGGMEGTSAIRNGVIAVPATNWTDPTGPGTGLVTALNAASGAANWSNPQDAPAASPAAIAGEIVFHAGLDGILHAYALREGTELGNTDVGASVSGGIAVAEGIVVLGAGTPQFAPFIRPGNTIRAFGLGGSPATPGAGTPTMATPVASAGG
ncbi:MAG: PQQ-binding-like beta-propeller repeat protein [Thermomicrobiales bacterium]